MITTIAKNDDRIIAGLLVGSRADKSIPGDQYQDYDVIYVVNDIEEFTDDAQWIKAFGDPILSQTPDVMVIPKGSNTGEEKTTRFACLMLFADYVRIDLTLVELDYLGSCVDTSAELIIDKKGVVKGAIDFKASNFLVTQPTQGEFSDCCNEFWWVSTYVVKGLLRSELLYAKRKLERPLRDMLLLMLSWKVGYEFNYAINLGSEYRFLKHYLNELEWKSLCNTYPLLSQRSIWESLNAMTDQFERIEKEVAKQLGHNYAQAEIDAVNMYLEDNFEDISKHF
ncbi:aminoglycoside 6-adenylyltransferase [Lewinella aquimaris]|uniref:Aminoglycoside 6-adenylyltransferase n=1 Tax=Neolewinella aquimaris TaxID=1835722 RepID=A0A840EF57_9BACT|nr:aminoglycoside 6-adenylyltransferase [Neolewinella aquimaris]